MLTTIAIILMLYAASALLYQADKRRAEIALLKTSPRHRTGARLLACTILVLTLWAASLPQGWERGIPIWLGLFFAAFVTSLFVSAQFKKAHLATLLATGSLGLVVAVIGLAGGII